MTPPEVSPWVIHREHLDAHQQRAIETLRREQLLAFADEIGEGHEEDIVDAHLKTLEHTSQSG